LTQDRVTDVSSAPVYQRDFVYDPVGNRTEQTIDDGSGATVVASTYDDRDRLLTADTTAYGWDTNGNLTSQDGTSYGWDFENRLTWVTLADGRLVETTYDADGNRVRTSVTPTGGEAATVVDYLVDTTGILSHVVADVVGGSVQTLYTRVDDQLIGLYRPGSGASRYYHADGLGSVRVLSDELGGVTDRYSYTAFGELLEHRGSDLNPYRFAGEAFDPNTGFSYNRARWLDLASGRFTSVDPFAGSVWQPVTVHRYSYANGDPVQMSDPSGLFVGGFAIAVVVAFITVSTSLAQITPSAPIARLENTGVFVQAHDVVVGRPVIADFYHLSIKIVPRNQQKWIGLYPKRFKIQSGSRVAFATLGAGPQKPPASGSLISEFNRDYDVSKSKAFFEKVGHSVDEDRLISYIMRIDAIYPDDQEYVLFPKPGKPGYNSNSYVAGILLAAGLQPPSFMLLHPELFPGAAKPLPLAQPGGKP
jgi:RHS repeat-associated protein